MKVIAVIPAVMPAENEFRPCLYEIAGKPVLGHVLDRVARAGNLVGLVVATTQAARDDAVVSFCESRGTPCFRGEAGNMLGLILAALKSTGQKGAVLVHPDSPLIDPAIVDHVANLVEMTDGMLDFVGTNLTPTYPKGMDVEGFTLAALEDSDRRCAEPEIRAQGTLYLRTHSRLYRILSVKPEAELHRPEMVLNVATVDDLAKIEAILRHFEGRNDFTLAELIAFVDKSAAEAADTKTA